MAVETTEWGPLRLHGKLLEGRTAIITGAASERGIGKATAKLFAMHGARVAIVDLDRKQVDAAVKTVAGNNHIGLVCDVTSQGQCSETVAQAIAAFGRVDILVNNAAVSKGTRILDVSLAEYDLVQDVNVKGTFLMSQAIVPHMRSNSAGNIVCLASVAGQRGGGLYGSSHYAASKAGAIGLGKALGRELAADNIRVNIVSPSLIKTDGSPNDSAQRRVQFEQDVPLRRSGSVWEVAGAILFAASDLSGYCTGATIDVNGGFHIH